MDGGEAYMEWTVVDKVQRTGGERRMEWSIGGRGRRETLLVIYIDAP
jgi:hypothetical protein